MVLITSSTVDLRARTEDCLTYIYIYIYLETREFTSPCGNHRNMTIIFFAHSPRHRLLLEHYRDNAPDVAVSNFYSFRLKELAAKSS